jgi:hypothetical protein
MSDRANPFGDLASEFAPTPKLKAKPVEPAVIEQLAADNGFPSRQAVSAPASAPLPAVRTPAREEPTDAKAMSEAPRLAMRRYTTGRNRQLNLKVSDVTMRRFYDLADAQGVPLALLFEQAVQALETALQSEQRRA